MNIREEQTFALFAFHLVRETLYLTLSPSHFYQLSFQGVSRAYSFQSIFFQIEALPHFHFATEIQGLLQTNRA